MLSSVVSKDKRETLTQLRQEGEALLSRLKESGSFPDDLETEVNSWLLRCHHLCHDYFGANTPITEKAESATNIRLAGVAGRDLQKSTAKERVKAMISVVDAAINLVQ